MTHMACLSGNGFNHTVKIPPDVILKQAETVYRRNNEILLNLKCSVNTIQIRIGPDSTELYYLLCTVSEMLYQ